MISRWPQGCRGPVGTAGVSCGPVGGPWPWKEQERADTGHRTPLELGKEAFISSRAPRLRPGALLGKSPSERPTLYGC